jgi:hypothetical protein
VSTSVLLLLVGVGCGAGFGALAVYGQVGRRGRLREVEWRVPAGVLVVGALLGAWTAPFTPTSAAAHRLEVTVLTVDVPAVHLLVTDPEKTDGERAPGY